MGQNHRCHLLPLLKISHSLRFVNYQAFKLIRTHLSNCANIYRLYFKSFRTISIISVNIWVASPVRTHMSNGTEKQKKKKKRNQIKSKQHFRSYQMFSTLLFLWRALTENRRNTQTHIPFIQKRIIRLSCDFNAYLLQALNWTNEYVKLL